MLPYSRFILRPTLVNYISKPVLTTCSAFCDLKTVITKVGVICSASVTFSYLYPGIFRNSFIFQFTYTLEIPHTYRKCYIVAE